MLTADYQLVTSNDEPSLDNGGVPAGRIVDAAAPAVAQCGREAG